MTIAEQKKAALRAVVAASKQAAQAVQPPTKPPKPPKLTFSDIIARKHFVCDTLIKLLYGEDADVNAYKVYINDEVKRENIKGVDITALDHSTPELYAAGKVAYDPKVKVALESLGFTKSEAHGGVHVCSVGGVVLKTYGKSKAQTGMERSALYVFQYKQKRPTE